MENKNKSEDFLEIFSDFLLLKYLLNKYCKALKNSNKGIEYEEFLRNSILHYLESFLKIFPYIEDLQTIKKFLTTNFQEKDSFQNYFCNERFKNLYFLEEALSNFFKIRNLWEYYFISILKEIFQNKFLQIVFLFSPFITIMLFPFIFGLSSDRELKELIKRVIDFGVENSIPILILLIDLYVGFISAILIIILISLTTSIILVFQYVKDLINAFKDRNHFNNLRSFSIKIIATLLLITIPGVFLWFYFRFISLFDISIIWGIYILFFLFIVHYYPYAYRGLKIFYIFLILSFEIIISLVSYKDILSILLTLFEIITQKN